MNAKGKDEIKRLIRQNAGLVEEISDLRAKKDRIHNIFVVWNVLCISAIIVLLLVIASLPSYKDIGKEICSQRGLEFERVDTSAHYALQPGWEDVKFVCKESDKCEYSIRALESVSNG